MAFSREGGRVPDRLDTREGGAIDEAVALASAQV